MSDFDIKFGPWINYGNSNKEDDIKGKMTELVNAMDVFCGLRCTEVESGWAQFREVNVCGGRCALLGARL